MDKKEKSNNHFLLGLIIGGALTYLVATERGREILKELFDEGMEKVQEMTSPEPEEEPGVYNDEPEAETAGDPEEKDSKKRFFKAKK
ncbi:MAG: YtxH domain-containing protein [Candidatus Levyibacteriota bacterium]